MISPKHLDMLSLRWDEIRDRTYFPSHTPVIIDGKKRIRLTPRIFAIPVRQDEERMKELGLQGSTNSKWFQVLIISFKCPAPCTSPHIFCGWHSHRTPPCHQPGLKAVIMTMTMSSYYDFIRPSRFELSHPHKRNVRNTNNKIIQKNCSSKKKLSHNTWPSVSNGPWDLACVPGWAVEPPKCHPGTKWTVLAAQASNHDLCSKATKWDTKNLHKKRKIQENSDFSKRPSPCPWLPHYRPRVQPENRNTDGFASEAKK